jgi:dihydrofolate reductase
LVQQSFKSCIIKNFRETGIHNPKVIGGQLSDNINRVKQQEGKNILIFGSPGASQSLLNEGLIDEFWLFVNPIILGKGMPLFKEITGTIKVKLIESKTFACGVIALHYGKL